VRRYWYADSVKDIAKAMSLTENNVSVTLNRLRSRLRDYLEERGVEL
jgi:RNA polymerase sigma-70 factor (ECF subfamily)